MLPPAGYSRRSACTAAYTFARRVPEGLPLLAAYEAALGVLNTSAVPLLMSSVSAEYLRRAMVVFQPVNQAGGISMLACGWLAGTALRGFRAAGLGPVSLLLLAGTALITAAAIRAAAIPRT